MNVSDAVESYKKLKDQHTNDSSSQDIVSILKNTDGVDLSNKEIKNIQNLIWIIQLSYIVCISSTNFISAIRYINKGKYSEAFNPHRNSPALISLRFIN